MQSRRARTRGDAQLDQAMDAFVDHSWLDLSERNSMAVTLDIHTKPHTLTLVERVGPREINLRAFLYE